MNGKVITNFKNALIGFKEIIIILKCSRDETINYEECCNLFIKRKGRE